jgi:hypothetical protein
MRPSQLPVGGTERYTTRRVTFVRPFTLGKAEEIYAAGEYDVETKEEAVDRGGYTANVRTATMLIIRTAAGTRSRQVNGGELDEALLRDAEDGQKTDPSENPDRGRAEGDAAGAAEK